MVVREETVPAVLTEQEANLIRQLRALRYGEVSLRVEQGAPVRQLPQRRQQRPAGARRLHAVVRAAQQREAQLLLERRHHPAQAGGGVVQFFRCRREAPGLEHGQQCAAFFRVHKLPPSLRDSQGTVETLSLYAMI